MTPIYCHEYSIMPMNRDSKMGVQQIIIRVVTETKENQHFEAVEKAIKMLDGQNLNISHKIVLEGYRND